MDKFVDIVAMLFFFLFLLLLLRNVGEEPENAIPSGSRKDSNRNT